MFRIPICIHMYICMYVCTFTIYLNVVNAIALPAELKSFSFNKSASGKLSFVKSFTQKLNSIFANETICLACL